MSSRPHPTARDEAVVRLVDLRKSFGSQSVLRGVTLDFPAGLTTVVLGPSGCGKSVMLKHVVGLLRPDSGEVWYEDQRIDTRPERRLREIRKEFGFLFQQSALFDSMTVRENVVFPLVEHTRLRPEQREERMRGVLAMVGLGDDGIPGKMPGALSGGQRKRVALARAIVLEPKVVLYDEPTTGLDPIRADAISELILKLQSRLRISSIVVTHDLANAFKVADRIVMLYDGLIVASGTVDELRASEDPVVQRFLRGEASPEDLAALDEVTGTG